MAKRNTSRKYDTKSVKEVKAENAVSDTVSLMIQIDTIYKAIGKFTGIEYVWHGAGNIQSVERNDAEDFLVKYIRRGCCGAGRLIKPVFVEVI